MPKKEKKGTALGRRIGWVCLIGLLILWSARAFGQDYELEPFRWGMNLEELNRALKEKQGSGLIREDKERIQIDLQYGPFKTIRIPRGRLAALVLAADPSKSGRLFGYLYDGKLVGKITLFKDTPEIYPEKTIRQLKEKYPQGRLYRSYGTASSLPLFEYKTEDLVLFSFEKGILFYDPARLESIVKSFQKQIELDDIKYNQEMREKYSTTR
jgi:hypothetical protein